MGLIIIFISIFFILKINLLHTCYTHILKLNYFYFLFKKKIDLLISKKKNSIYDLIERPTSMSFYTKEQMNSHYERMLRLFNPKKGDIGFSWISHMKDVSLFNWNEIIPQVRFWRNNNVRAFEYNNRECEVNGRTWYILIAQPYKDGELEECPICPLALLVFGIGVNGYTYAFSTKQDRDHLFQLINTDDETFINEFENLTTTAKANGGFIHIFPKCCVCAKSCENEFGNNPYPFASQKSLLRCCDKCNKEKVIPARMNHIFWCADVETEDDKKIILNECEKIINKQIENIWHEVLASKGVPRIEEIKHSITNFKVLSADDNLVLQTLGTYLTSFKDEVVSIVTSVKTEVMVYASQRLGRHLNVRKSSSPADICLTTRDLANQLFYTDGIRLASKLKEINDEFLVFCEVRRRLLEEYIASQSENIVVEVRNEDKTHQRKETEKERTKNANKSQGQKKAEKKKEEEKLALAYAKKMEQQKKKQQEIARKKKQAQLKQFEKINSSSESDNDI